MTQSNNQVIGVFDSGLGGLTVLKEIVKKASGANIIYLGDIKHSPYGERTQSELGALTAIAFSFLKGMGADKIVTACNSVSTLLMGDFLKTCNISEDDVIEMSKPTALALKAKYKKVLVLATTATVRSHMHRDALSKVGIYADEMAVPGLVDLIESDASMMELQEHIIGILGSMNVSCYDAILLGCTHFPFALKAFSNVLGSDVVFIDPANAVADVVVSNTNIKNNKKGMLKFFVTEESEVFNEKIKKIFGDEYKVNVV